MLVRNLLSFYEYLIGIVFIIGFPLCIIADWLFAGNWLDFFAVYYIIGLIISFFVVVGLGFFAAIIDTITMKD